MKPSTANTVGIGILCKPPRPGLSKTRLAADIGAEAACRLAAAFLKDVADTAASVAASADAKLYAFYRPADAAAEVAPYFPPGVPLRPQESEELGSIMRLAIEHMLNDCPGGALVIGTDVPQADAGILHRAVETLSAHRPSAVIGPADDGGYYLIGMTARESGSLLDPLPWSTPDVFRLTSERAAALGLPFHVLDRLTDVDDLPSLERLASDLARLPSHIAPATRTALAGLNVGLSSGHRPR